jgi:competence protein ComEC
MGKIRFLLAIALAAAAPVAAYAKAAAPAALSAESVEGIPADGTYRLHAIDVGTGLSVFVEGHDFALLFDAGSNDDFARGDRNRVLAYLHKIRPDLARIDHLILSHPHKDHSELMPDVLGTYQVANLWDSGALNPICSYRLLLTAASTKAGLAYHDSLGDGGTHNAAFAKQTCYGKPLKAATIRVPRGSRINADPITLGAGAQMTILHADGTVTNDFNDASVVVRLDLGGRRVLLPGDAQGGQRKPPTDPVTPSSVEGQVLACCKAALAADLLVAGHHGSKTSSRTAFLDAIGAKTFIVSAGPTKYATVTLPDTVVMDELKRRGVVWETDLDDAHCRTNPAKIGPDADNKPGGCDNVVVLIGPGGTLNAGYYRAAD